MGRLLLVGNSRWHWGRREPGGLRTWHAAAPRTASGDDWADLDLWAAVGRLPEGIALPPARRLGLERVPLQQLPPWLGVDRALAGWQAWRAQQAAVLVADAGTCLSLTWVDGQGCFRGGRLSAGLALQLRSLGAATAQLPQLPGPEVRPMDVAAQSWPRSTREAMEQGCLRACAAGIAQAWRELNHTSPAEAVQLWLTGGDAEQLDSLLRQQGIEPVLDPDLCLRALEQLSAEPQRR